MPALIEKQAPESPPGGVAEPMDEATAARLADFAGRFRPVFARADQARWLPVYLRGLLQPGGRKCVEAMVRTLPEFADRPAAAAQALQNFLHQSPWDEGRLLAALWAELLPAWRQGGGGPVVAHEVALPKRGTHSVGVQRQLAAEQNRKVNCQVAVAVGAVGPAGYVPLAIRLYLPRAWQRDDGRLDAAGVPAEHRAAATKADMAAGLLDALRAGGWPVGGVAAVGGLATADELSEALASRGLARAELGPDAAAHLAGAVASLRDEYGLGHFEGRSWRGWHHHTALALAAWGFRWLARRGDGPA